eukprot:TRINITY_DN1927_c0_g2_i2.p1 TRINITY_DN1927_c0_g2~~TRINITY_DN1927_c0_g2_i2.p1  ORF type:complete len:479 (-),score=173.79 TRINITY_DN1927_c0_g2_i2:84-1388(-)
MTDSKSNEGKAFKFAVADRAVGFDSPSVFSIFTPLAQEYKAANLGQGFPDFLAPEFVKQAGVDAINQNFNQYTRSQGHVSLTQQLAARYTELLGRPINALTNVMTAVGSSEVLFSATQSLLNPGDEVIAFEPAYDIYAPCTQMGGAKFVGVPLKVENGRWVFDAQELAAAFTDKTRILILNTPHNPTGKVFTRAELESIASIVQQYPNCVVICDEVYEYLYFDGNRHTYFATLPGMFDRTICVSSAGKTFSVTGWKIGWAVGPEHLVKGIQCVHQWVPFCIATPFQEAIARVFQVASQPYEGHADYYAWFQDLYLKKRNFLCDALKAAGIEPVISEGSFFVMGDTSRVQIPDQFYWSEQKNEAGEVTRVRLSRDYAFCIWLTKEIGVTAIPPSAFYRDETKHLAANYARFAFCKADSVLESAAERLQRVREFLG